METEVVSETHQLKL